MTTDQVRIEGRKLLRVMMGTRRQSVGRGSELLALLREYREDIRAPLVAENARLRAELECLKSARLGP